MRVQVVSFHCVLKTKLGQFISSSFNQDVITTPLTPESPLLPGFVEALQKLKKGQRRKITLTADQAYGFYDLKLVITLPRSRFRDYPALAMGDLVQALGPYDEIPRQYRVIACSTRSVTLDGNHPLAGQDLVFDVKVVSSREENDLTLHPRFKGTTRLLC